METLREVLAPGFVLRNSVYIGLLVGLTCPLVGGYLVMRRMIFMGIALPQISSCGIAFAFALQGWGLLPHPHGTTEEHALAFGGSMVFTLLSILILTLLEKRRGGSVEGRLGAFYVLAGAWSILLLVKNPFGEHGMLDLLKGEIIAVPNSDLVLSAGVFGFAVIPLILFHKEFLLVSFDPEMATTLKKSVRGWDGLLFSLVGLIVSISVLSVGPLVTFGFLLVPSLIAYQLTRTMKQFLALSSIIGGLSAVVGFVLAYRWDLPVGATDVALLGILLILTFFAKRAATLFGPRCAAKREFPR
ncbi:MAG: metal ABC transporter permease [Verrucomicrobia subdivision 3 bacterium]|nr:metal ABC transporter permease [Limisphaerales bacterium]